MNHLHYTAVTDTCQQKAAALLYPEIIAGTREVTLEDIEKFERLIMPLRDCQHKVVWY